MLLIKRDPPYSSKVSEKLVVFFLQPGELKSKLLDGLENYSFIQQILVEHLPSAKDWELGSEHTAVSENGTVADPTLPSSSQVER